MTEFDVVDFDQAGKEKFLEGLKGAKDDWVVSEFLAEYLASGANDAELGRAAGTLHSAQNWSYALLRETLEERGLQREIPVRIRRELHMKVGRKK